MALYSNEAEVEILSACMSDKEVLAEITEQMTPEDFFVPTNTLIYSKIVALYSHSKDVSAISIYETMANNKDSVSLHDLLQISSSTASPKAYQTYVDIIKDFSNKRKIQTVCRDVMRDIETKPSKKLLEEMGGEIFTIGDKKSKQSVVNDETLMGKTLTYVQTALNTKGEGVGMRTGWKTFDTAIGGFERGNMVVIAGRTSMGKTAFTLQLMEKLALKNYRSLLFELEMTEIELGLRRLASNSNLNMLKIRAGNIGEEEILKLMAEADRSAREDKILTDTTASISLLEIRNRVRRAKASPEGLDFVIVDHIGLMKGEKGENRNLEISSITAGLKALAKEYDITVVVLWQLSRDIERRTDKRPTLSDLRDSGAGEQDSDIVIFMYRDAYYSRDQEIKEQDLQELEVIIGKNRNGKTGTILFDYSMKTQRIWEAEQ